MFDGHDVVTIDYKLLDLSIQTKGYKNRSGQNERRDRFMPRPDLFEIPAEMRAVAERGFEQANKPSLHSISS